MTKNQESKIFVHLVMIISLAVCLGLTAILFTYQINVLKDTQEAHTQAIQDSADLLHGYEETCDTWIYYNETAYKDAEINKSCINELITEEQLAWFNECINTQVMIAWGAPDIANIDECYDLVYLPDHNDPEEYHPLSKVIEDRISADKVGCLTEPGMIVEQKKKCTRYIMARDVKEE